MFQEEVVLALLPDDEAMWWRDTLDPVVEDEVRVVATPPDTGKHFAANPQQWFLSCSIDLTAKKKKALMKALAEWQKWWLLQDGTYVCVDRPYIATYPNTKMKDVVLYPQGELYVCRKGGVEVEVQEAEAKPPLVQVYGEGSFAQVRLPAEQSVTLELDGGGKAEVFAGEGARVLALVSNGGLCVKGRNSVVMLRSEPEAKALVNIEAVGGEVVVEQGSGSLLTGNLSGGSMIWNFAREAEASFVLRDGAVGVLRKAPGSNPGVTIGEGAELLVRISARTDTFSPEGVRGGWMRVSRYEQGKLFTGGGE